MLMKFDVELHHIAVIACMVFTAVATFFSIREVIKHLQVIAPGTAHGMSTLK